MPDDLSPLQEAIYAAAIDEFGELLMQSDKAFLFGAGCSKCAGVPLTAELTAEALNSDALESTTKTILAFVEKQFKGAVIANIEDYLSELVDLVAIAERRSARGAAKDKVTLDGVDYSAAQLKVAVDQIKEAIANAIDVEVNLETHWKFIQAVHRPLASRKGGDYSTCRLPCLELRYIDRERPCFRKVVLRGRYEWWQQCVVGSGNLPTERPCCSRPQAPWIN